MKKVGTALKAHNLLIAIIFILAIMPFASAEVLLKEKVINNVIVKELNLPATYDITIINNGAYDFFTIDALYDVNITPSDPIGVDKNSEKTVSIQVYPSKALRDNQIGLFSVVYYAKGDESDLAKSILDMNFVSLADLISIEMPSSISKDASSMKVRINLTEDTVLNADLTIVSELLSYKKQISLTNKEIELTVPLKAIKPQAGTYEVKFTFDIDGYDYTESKDLMLESVIKTEEGASESGWFMCEKTEMTKENTGNSVTDVTVSLSKSVISGLFTSFSMKPTSIKRSGSTVTYEFTQELNPGDKLTVDATTSYYLPLIIIILLIVAAWIFVYVLTPQVKVDKKAVKVRTRSGVFATKIVLSVKNKGKKEVNDLKIIDRLPAFTELVPGKFGTISPSEVRKRTLIWNLDRLEVNEEVMLSYIVYSKLTIIGKLDIPITFVTYKDLNGKLHEAKSNNLAVIAPEQSPIQTEVIR